MASEAEGANGEQRGLRAIAATVSWPAGILGVGLVAGFIVLLVLSFERPAEIIAETRLWLSQALKFLYLGGVSAALAFCLWLFFAPVGKVRLGAEGDRPDFGFWTWLAMMVGAGMGLGLVVWSVAEPLFHLLQHPLVNEQERESVAAAEPALRFSMLHWGLHPWAVYTLAAAAFGYAAHRRRRPLGASALLPKIGTRTVPPGLRGLVDGVSLAIALLAVIASTAMAAGQIDTSGAILFGYDSATAQAATATDLAREAAAEREITDPAAIAAMIEAAQPFPRQPLIIIGGLFLFSLLVLSQGLQRGIREAGLVLGVLALLYLGFIVLFGPTNYVLQGWVQAIGDYLAHFLALGLWANVEDRNSDWQNWWTLFYWSWWLALAIPMGLFIALISRGRTLRQLVGGALIASSVTVLTWTGIAGAAAVHGELLGEGGLAAAVKDDPVRAVHTMFDGMQIALLDRPIPELEPAGPLLFTVVLIGAAVLFLAAGVLVLDRLSARVLLPGLAVRRTAWALIVVAGAAALWLYGGDRLVQLFRSAVFIAGTLALLLFAVGAWSLAADLLRETRTGPAPAEDESSG